MEVRMTVITLMLLAAIYSLEVWCMTWGSTTSLHLTLAAFVVHTLITVWFLFIDPLDVHARKRYLWWFVGYLGSGALWAVTMFA